MFIPIDADTVAVTWRPPGPETEKVAIGRDGKPRRIYTPELPSAWLEPWDGQGDEPAWTTAKVYVDDIMLTDPVRGVSWLVPVDRAALGLGDVEALDITASAPLPGRPEVVIGVSRSQTAAIWNYETRTSELITFEGLGNIEPFAVQNGAVWLTNYNTLCKLQAPRTMICSRVLQGRIETPEGAYPTSYVGRPVYAPSKKGWLVPRPDSGDIVLVDEMNLEMRARIPLGGRPFIMHMFDDGAMVILSDTYDAFQTAKLKDLRDF